MIGYHETDIINQLQSYINSWEEENLIFSYAIKQSPETDGMNITIHQQETGFSLTIQLKEIDDALSVTKFLLTEKSDLEQQSLSLYDAAVVEIAVQALDLLFIIADHADASEIAFAISKNEAVYLTAFACFFDADYVLQTAPHDYDAFVHKTEILKTTIRCELWQRQWHDRYLRNYLQNCQKGQVFSQAEFISAPPQPSNIIAFPL